MQLRSGGGGIVVQKWREGDVSVNTFYFTIRNCCKSGVNMLWDCIESVQKMWQARPRSLWFKVGRRWQRGSSSAGRVCHRMLEKGAISWFPKSRSEQKRRWKFQCTQIYQLVHSNQWQLVLEHFLLISILKIQIWNTGISFLFDHVVPQWPAGPLRSNHFYFYNRNLSNNRFFPNNIHKSINKIFFIIRNFSINNRKISIKNSETHN